MVKRHQPGAGISYEIPAPLIFPPLFRLSRPSSARLSRFRLPTKAAPRPASTRFPNNRQHAARAAPSLHPTRFLPNKSPPSIPRPYSQTALFPTPQRPTPRPGAPGNSQPSPAPSGNPRQLPAHAFTSRARNTHKHPQAPLPPSERPAILRVPGSLPSTRQSSERAPSFPRQTLARIAAPTHPPPRNPEIPNTARHPETQKKRSRRNAGSAPNYLQVFTRSYLSRSESGSGSCSSPYC